MSRRAKDRGLSQKARQNGEAAPEGEAAAAPQAVADPLAHTSEIRHIAPAPEPVPPAVATKVSADTIFTGELLKQIRESQRITLKEISDRTRLSVHSLAALESERYEDLPNARVYVRGFVRCLAAEIGLDKDHVSRTYVPRWEAWFAALNSR